MSGATGHFVCVDGFGPTSDEEKDAGLRSHGEAVQQTWEVVPSGAAGVDTPRSIANRPGSDHQAAYHGEWRERYSR